MRRPCEGSGSHLACRGGFQTRPYNNPEFAGTRDFTSTQPAARTKKCLPVNNRKFKGNFSAPSLGELNRAAGLGLPVADSHLLYLGETLVEALCRQRPSTSVADA